MSPKEVKPSGDGSPLLNILQRIDGGISLAEFSRRVGCNYDNLRNQVKGRRKNPSFSVRQWKQVMQMLNEAGIPLSEFPDDFAEKN